MGSQAVSVPRRCQRCGFVESEAAGVPFDVQLNGLGQLVGWLAVIEIWGEHGGRGTGTGRVKGDGTGEGEDDKGGCGRAPDTQTQHAEDGNMKPTGPPGRRHWHGNDTAI